MVKKERKTIITLSAWVKILGLGVMFLALIISTNLVKSNKPTKVITKAAACHCVGAGYCNDFDIYGRTACEQQPGCAWVCSPTATPDSTPSCSSLGVTQPQRQCKCSDCDISGSHLCKNANGVKKQCCTNNLSWAHGGCCRKDYVWCGCATNYPREVLLFCANKDLSHYGTVTFLYTSTDGKCPTNPCP